jgi:HAD superfamily hydrolase (TIGR01509 family)
MKLVIFDCDGVLINSKEIYVDSEIEFLSKAGFRLEKRAYMEAFMGLSQDDWRAKLGTVVQQRNGQALPENFFDSLHAFVMQRFESELAPISGVRGAVSNLEITCCVASSSRLPNLQWKLEHAGIADLFSAGIFSADMVDRGKPAPDLFLHAAATLAVEPRRCVVVEDSANGVIAGKAAGMMVVGFTGGGHCPADQEAILLDNGAQVVIDDFARLGSTISRLVGST